MNPVVKFRLATIAFLLLVYGLLISQKINLQTADLGRHLKNGEMVLQGDPLQIWRTNFYSYTYPDFPFVNHHWGSGVVFYLIQKVFGFSGLSLFFSLLSLAAFLIFFRIARRGSRFGVALLAALMAIPILASRAEIRPEAFSYLLAGVFWWILSESRRRRRFLWLLPFLTLLWVNLHIYFFLGFFLIGVFGIEELFLILGGKKRDWKNLKNLAVVGGLCLAASFLNPAGLRGVLYPLQIFKGYGYRLFENQTVWFLDKIVKYPPSLYFKIAFGVLVLSWIYAFWGRKKISICNLIFTICYSFMGWTAVRNFTLFGYFMIPIIAYNLKDIRVMGKTRERPEVEDFVAASFGAVLLLGLFLFNSSYWLARVSVGFGLEKGNGKAAEFFLKENLKGPIFNNYDIGGYLIYFLYPQEKVFVDNRPEAYPKEFFEKTYIPMQEQEGKWKEVDKKYNFNTIFFYRHDLTPWGQKFLVERVRDPAWAPVYVDDWSIIFLKRNTPNQALIKKYELPKEIFTVK